MVPSSEFGSVVDTVNCALVQRAALRLPGRSRALPAERIVLRDRDQSRLTQPRRSGDDIYGDGVNIAARLEPLAEPGGICARSNTESIGNRNRRSLQDAGDITVKNIDRPIRTRNGIRRDTRRNQTRAIDKPRLNVETLSIAVLPFTNMSATRPSTFRTASAVSIITDLSKIAGLTVIARNPHFTYKGRRSTFAPFGRDSGAVIGA